jgi:hypothetical protein
MKYDEVTLVPASFTACLWLVSKPLLIVYAFFHLLNFYENRYLFIEEIVFGWLNPIVLLYFLISYLRPTHMSWATSGNLLS